MNVTTSIKRFLQHAVPNEEWKTHALVVCRPISDKDPDRGDERKTRVVLIRKDMVKSRIEKINEVEDYEYYIGKGVYKKDVVGKTKYCLSTPHERELLISEKEIRRMNDALRGKLYGKRNYLIKRINELWDTPIARENKSEINYNIKIVNHKICEIDDKIKETYENDEINPYTGYIGSAEKNLFGYRNIVLDLHGNAAETEKLFLYIKTHADIVKPDHFVRTGDGAQLWFVFEMVAVALKWKVDAVQGALVDTYQDMLAAAGIDLELDLHSTTDAAGFYRLPGTVNAATGAEITVFNFNWKDTRTLDRLGYLAGKKVHKISPIAALPSRRIKAYEDIILESCVCNPNPYQLKTLLHLIAVEMVVRGKDLNAIVDLLACWSGASIDHDELERIAKVAITKKYHYSNRKIAEVLKLTDEEIERYGFAEPKRYQRKDNTKRDNAIIRLKKQGDSTNAVAKKLCISRGTVTRVYGRYVMAVRKKMTETLATKKNKVVSAVASRRMPMPVVMAYAEHVPVVHYHLLI